MAYFWRRLLTLLCLLTAFNAHALTLLEPILKSTLNLPNSDVLHQMAMTADGSSLYMVDQTTKKVVHLSRASNGTLNYNSTNGSVSFTAETINAALIAASPDSKHVYVLFLHGSGVGSIVGLSRNTTTGTLTLLGSGSIASDSRLNNANSLAISPEGTRLYVGVLTGKIVAYDRNTSSGALTFAVESADNFSDLFSLAISQDSAFVYAGGDNKVIACQKSDLAVVKTLNDGDSSLKLKQPTALVARTNRIYVAASGDSALSVLTGNGASLAAHKSYVAGDDTSTGKVVGLGSNMLKLVMPSDSSRLYVLNSGNPRHQVTVFKPNGNDLNFDENLAINPPILLPSDMQASPADSHVYFSDIASGNYKAVVSYATAATDLAISNLTESNDPVVKNTDVTYTVTVKNNGGSDATGVTLSFKTTDSTAATLTRSGTVTGGSACTGPVDNTLSCAIGALANGAIKEVVLKVRADKATVLTNTLTVVGNETDPSTGNNSKTEQTTVLTQAIEADLAVTLVSSPTVEVNLSSDLVYTAVVTNKGPETAASTTLKLDLSAGHGLTYQATKSSVSNGGSCNVNGTNQILCSLNSLVNQDAVTVKFAFQTQSTGTATVNATATTASTVQDNNSQGGSNTAVVNSLVVKLLQVDLAIDPITVTSANSFLVGEKLTYGLMVRNNHGSTGAQQTVLTHTLPPDSEFISASPSTAHCSESTKIVTCNLGTIAALGNSGTVTVDVRPIAAGTLTYAASVRSLETDTAPTNNSQTKPAAINGNVADIVVNVTESADPINIGHAVTYTIKVTNNGPQPASTVQLSNQILGTNLSVATPTTTSGTCGAGANFSSTFIDLALDTSATVTVAVTASKQEVITYNASATASSSGQLYDPQSPNRQIQTTTVAATTADMGLTLTATPATTTLNNLITYTATLSNKGPSAANGVILTDVLPSGVTYDSAVAGQGSCAFATVNSITTVTCQLGDLASGATTTVLVKVKAVTAGTINNKMDVSNSAFDANVADNTASVSTSVAVSSANLTVSMTESADPVIVQGELTYEVIVTNQGPDPATQVVLIDTLPTGITLLEDLVSQGTACVNNNPVLTCALGTINSGASAKLSLRLRPDQASMLLNAASVTLNESDPKTTDNNATITTQVTSAQNLFFVKAYVEGQEGIKGIKGATAVTVSHDGKSVYAAGYNGNSLAVFARSTSGELVLLQTLEDDLNGVKGLGGANALSLSDDDKSVYVSAFNDHSLTVFSRDTATGKLTFAQTQNNSTGPYDVAVKGDFVYTANAVGNSITVYQRDPASGGLAVLETVTGIANLKGVVDLAISDDGTQMYAAAATAGALLVFNRDSNTGKLTLSQEFNNDAGKSISGLNSAYDVTTFGAFVYVASNSENSVALFARDATSKAVNFVEKIGNITGLTGVTALTLSPDHHYLYAAGTNADSLGIFTLTQSSGKLSYSNVVTQGINNVTGLQGIQSVALSPDGTTIYTAALHSNAVALFRVPSADLTLVNNVDQTKISLGENLTYTLTVTNNGPQQATGVTLLDDLSDKVTLVSATPSKGEACTQSGSVIRCNLGVLTVNGFATVTVVVTPKSDGDIINTASVSASQQDATVPNQSTVTSQAAGIADLLLNLASSTQSGPVGSPLTYQATITNRGPQKATGLTLKSTLPATAQYLSSTTAQGKCTHNAGVVSCQLGDLAAQATTVVAIEIKPSSEGTLALTAETSAAQQDPTLPNSATLSAVILTNVVDGTINNQDKTLSNHIIATTGIVINGTLSGTIVNRGIIENLTIANNARVINENGQISGKITHNGTLENGFLRQQSRIDGGKVKGVITGEPISDDDTSHAARINADILAGTQLSNLVIEAGSTVAADVVIGTGLRFASLKNIPASIDLSSALPHKIDPVTLSNSIDLTYSLLEKGDSLIKQINTISQITALKWTLSQNDLGQTLLTIGQNQFALLPLAMRQASGEFSPSIKNEADGRVVFTVASGQVITAYPALQDPVALKTILQQAGFNESLRSGNNGEISLLHEKLRFVVKPAASSQALASTRAGLLSETLLFDASTQVKGATVARLTFEQDGQFYMQKLYPAPADQTAFIAMLEAIPGADNVLLQADGFFSVRVSGLTFKGLFDYPIVAGSSANTHTVAQYVSISDVNGDGIDDFRIVYPNGEQQQVFYIPPDDLITEIRAIPDLINGHFQVTALSDNRLELRQGVASAHLRLLPETQVDYQQPATLLIEADGSVKFITGSARQVMGLPLVQNRATMERLFAKINVQIVREDGQSLYLLLNNQQLMVIRPALASLTSNTLTEGIYRTPVAQVSGLTYVRLVFLTETGEMREQYLYPNAPEPALLKQFLQLMPEAEQVVISNDGILSVTHADGRALVKGLFSYYTTPTGSATGGIQFNQISDQNSDGRADYTITYSDGQQQVLYSLP